MKELKGIDKNNRVLDLMHKLDAEKPVNTNSCVKMTKYGPDNKIYAIIKENNKYFIRMANKSTGILMESDFHIGEADNKNPNENKYNTYE